MDEMEDKIGAILNNPQMMQQIMSMAQAFNSSTPAQEPPPSHPMPNIDMGLLQKLSGLAQQSGIDKREQALLEALGGYLQSERILKLEKAMRAAKLAKFASSALGNGGLQSLLGR